MMFITDRFIASAISLVRMAPEAPTSAPEMIRTGLPSTKPAIAAAVPVNELSRLMTTGMSAPPMGRTMVIPKIRPARTTRPRTSRATSLVRETAPAAVAMSTTVPRTATTARPTVMSRPPGRKIGLPAIRPWSLPPAMSEPVKVIEPMRAPSTTKIVVSTATAPSRMKSSIATRAAAPPPTALNSDTSCGIAVIFTVRAVYSPAPPPMAKPTTMIASAIPLRPPSRVISQTSVATTAMTIPAALSWLPLRPVAGEFIRCRPSTKQDAPASQAR